MNLYENTTDILIMVMKENLQIQIYVTLMNKIKIKMLWCSI
jgi:hypothetical protein